ncbi:MAG: hypothetical protein ACFB9N_11850 [Geitlerinemataceae cyanobacterium]
MKRLIPILLAASSVAIAARTAPARAHDFELCQAYTVNDASEYGFREVNNCPLTIAGTFTNATRSLSITTWETALYHLEVWDPSTGTMLTDSYDFDIIGRTDRPQYRFLDGVNGHRYVVSFQYDDPNFVRLEIYNSQGDRFYNALFERAGL